MTGKIVIIMLISVIMVLTDFKRKRDRQKAIKASLLFVYTFSILYAGMITRAVPPLFALHLLLVLICWGVTALYIIKDKLYIWIYALPILNIILLFILNFLEGARYEG